MGRYDIVPKKPMENICIATSRVHPIEEISLTQMPLINNNIPNLQVNVVA